MKCQHGASGVVEGALRRNLNDLALASRCNLAASQRTGRSWFPFLSATIRVTRGNDPNEESAELKTTRLLQFQIYAFGGETLRPMSFTIPEGALGSYAATGPIPAHSSSITTPQQFTGFIFRQASQNQRQAPCLF